MSSAILSQTPTGADPLPVSGWRRIVDSPAAPIVLLAAFAGLIAWTINRFSIWIDESGTLLVVGRNGYVDIIHRVAVYVHPPLWYLVLKPWLQLFGNTLVAARAQSGVFMLAALGVWYHFVRTRFSRPLAVLTLALAVTNPMLLHYAVEARMYAFGVLLTAASCVFLTGTARWRWFAYWLCAVAMLYVHYFLAFPIAGQFVFLLLRSRQLRLSWLWIVVYGASIVAAFATWLPHAFHQTADVLARGFWIGPVAPSSVVAFVLHTFLHRVDSDLQGRLVFPGLAYLAMWWAALIRARRAHNGPHALLWSLIAVPLLCLFVVSCPPLRPVFHPRYAVFGVPALITLLAAGALGFTGRWRSIAVSVLLVGHLCGLRMLRYRGFNETRGFWSMKQIAKEVSAPIDGELPWVVATWIFPFFDARATLDMRQHVTIRVDSPPEFHTPGVVYYGHPDWYIFSWGEIHARHVWVIDENGAPPVEVPANWKLEVTHSRGYARTRLFAIQTP